MKNKLILLTTLICFTSLACELTLVVSPSSRIKFPFPTEKAASLVPMSSTATPENTTSNSTEIAQLPQNELTAVTFGKLNLIIPSSIASGATGEDIPRFNSEDAAYWEKTPGHLQVELGDYYVLKGKFHQPIIYVYPAQDYAEMVPNAFESIRRVDNILYGPGGKITQDQLPIVPFFNAAQVFASNIKIIPFQNGSGVRFLTEYAQYAAPVNNHELIYHFQGMTRDGAYYVIAILPITAPELTETSDTASALPIGGVPCPDLNDHNADWNGYYTAVTNLLNTTPADAFTPGLVQLDALINSLSIRN